MLDLDQIQVTAPSAAPASSADPYARQQPHARLDQSEIIGSKELMALASSLSKRKNEKHAQIGRALVKAVRGELFAKHGERDAIALQMCAEIINHYPNCDPEGVVKCFLQALSRAQDDGSDLTPARFRAMLEHWQEKRQLKLNMVSEIAAGKLGEALREQQAQALLEAPLPSTESAEPAPVASVASPPPGFDPSNLTTLVIQADGDFYLRHVSGWTYRKLKGQTALSIELTRVYGASNATLVLYEQTGKKFPMQAILDAYATNARGVIYDYCTEAITYDAQRGLLRVGCAPLGFGEALPEPRYDVDVEAWLRALAGGTESDYEEICDWIAGTERRHINHAAAALVLVGAPDTGKSIFELALAKTWGIVPVPLKVAVDKFNGALLTGPFWHADEKMPEGLTNDVFREMVQSRKRLVEPKGRERVQLEGASRITITLNDLTDLDIGGRQGADAVEAVADRLLIKKTAKEPARAALDVLRIPGGNHDVDLDRVARHLRSLQLFLEPRKQRFYGAPESNAVAMSAVVEGIAEQAEGVIEALRRYFADPRAVERAYQALGSTSMHSTGLRFPIVVKYGKPYVYPKELGELAKVKDWEVRQALSPLRPATKPKRDIMFDSSQARYWELDPERVVMALGAEWGPAVAAALAQDTHERRAWGMQGGLPQSA